MKNYCKYLPITTTEKKWGFYIPTAGHTNICPGEIYPSSKRHPPTHSFTWDKGRILNGYYLVFISRGQGIFESATTKPQKISEGTCFFLFPDIWHRYKPDLNVGWEEYWVGFNGIFPKHIMDNNFFTPQNPVVCTGQNESLLILFQRLLAVVQNSNIGYHQIVLGITLEILGLVYTISNNKKQSANPDLQLIHKAKFILRESLEKPIDIQSMVKELPMGYAKFRKLFKEVTGHSPHQYQILLKINKAKELLETTKLNINEIAYQTGFESEFYFSKSFKKKTGMSPTLYRHKQQY